MFEEYTLQKVTR